MRTSAKDLERDHPDVEDPGQGEEAAGERVVPRLPDQPERFRQDTRPVDGETATHMPPGTEQSQRPEVQG